MKTPTTRKRSWRHRYRHFTESLPSKSISTLACLSERCKQLDLIPFDKFQQFELRKCLARLRRETYAILTHPTVAIAIVLIFILILQAESSVFTKNVSSSFGRGYRRAEKIIFDLQPRLSAVEENLHSFHSVPRKYMRLLPPENQKALLLLLSRPASPASLDPSARKGVFTRITGCQLSQCLRAFASALVYARTTGRVAVVFVDIRPDSIAKAVRLGAGGALGNDAIVTAIGQSEHEHFENTSDGVSDWAEFSLMQASAPAAFVSNYSVGTYSSARMGSTFFQKPVLERNELTENADHVLTIGNTNTIATLDNLAAVDVHVSLSLSEVIWSDFAPRSSQEEILSDYLDPTNRFSRRALRSASILGRHKETRNAKSAEEILYANYRIPRILLDGMDPLAKRLLLLKLMSKQRKGVSNPKTIFVHAQYGLGNRLRALGSAMAFARRTDRVLVLIWVPDQHLNCEFTDLFTPSDEFLLCNRFPVQEEWPLRGNYTNDKNMESVKWYNYMRINGMAARSAHEFVMDDKHHHIYVSTCYVIQSPETPFIIRTQSTYWNVLRTLTPHIHVLRLIDKFASYPMSSMIGVHIRGKSIKKDISGVSAADYSLESSKRTDYWRNLTQVETFVEEMRRQPPDQMFYVASDRKETFDRLDSEFPSRVFYTSRRCDSRDRDCLPFALADILLLARCSSIRGSYWSSFTELSVRIGGARFLLAGIDFGRP